MRRKVAALLAVAGLCLGIVATRAVLAGRGALARGDQAQAAGDPEEAVTWWRRAARWYLPLAPHVGGAYDRLEELGRAAEERGDVDLALRAWRGVRGSILATRSFFTPQRERLEPANRRIAALMAGIEDPSLDPNRSEPERADWHYALLARDDAPSVFWTVFALLGFAAWLGGAFFFALRGVTREDRLAPRPAAASGLLVAAGLILWMIGLYLA
jgi:hypothetical protein